MARQLVSSTSSCSHGVPASRPASAMSRAPWPQIAAISAGRDAICESRLMITQFWAVTTGIHSGSLTLGDVTGQAGRTRRLIVAPASPGKVQSGRSPHTT